MNDITTRASDALKTASENLQDGANRARQAARNAYEGTLSAYEDGKDRAIVAVNKGKENLAYGKEKAAQTYETAKVKGRETAKRGYEQAKVTGKAVDKQAGRLVEKNTGLALLGAFAVGVAAALVIPKR